MIKNNGAKTQAEGEWMSIKKGPIPVAVTLAVVCAVTAILWHFKLSALGPDHPVFIYLLPIGLVMIFYGSLPALLAVFLAAVCADYFLYDPLYSLLIDSRVELGDLTCFTFLAVLGVKCTGELFRPGAKIPAKIPALPKR